VPGLLLDGNPSSETRNAEQPIARTRAQLTAFVGRTLRGPIDTPVVVRSFADFHQTFGGLWQPSPLSYAVEHFFEQGGRQAVIVRVVNAALPASISLRCGRETLKLRAGAPGTREFLRASVDYDRLDPDDTTRFNLVVQRVRAPGSERIEEQESFRAVSTDPADPRYVVNVLLDSKMAKVWGPVPKLRPDATLMPGTNLPVGYVSSNPDGDDGKPVSDYDLIGSATRRSGLFALSDVEDLAFVYLPPLSRTTEVGVSALLVAAMFCREHRAMLIIDPPSQWDTPFTAVQGLKELNFYSDSAVMFYPRIACMDRLRGRTEVFGNGGAVAGLLSRLDESIAAAASTHEPEPLLRAGARLTREIGPADRWRLATAGINVLQTVRSVERNRPALRTLACGASASSDWAYLAPRRFALFVIGVIERGTRWCAMAPNTVETRTRVAKQIHEFLSELRAAGAFASVPLDQAFLVICDSRINDERQEPGEMSILLQLAALHAGEYHSFMITHKPTGSTVRPVVVNRLETTMVLSMVEQEITMRIEPEEGFRRILAG
jgi:hypothetical protein